MMRRFELRGRLGKSIDCVSMPDMIFRISCMHYNLFMKHDRDADASV
jgi:hypothetical protein